MARQSVSGVSPWEPIFGYARAVRTGNHVFVAGTASIADDGTTHGVGDPYAQGKRALEIIDKALSEVGASMADVVKTRLFYTDRSHWDDYVRAHGEVFSEIRPVSTAVQVAGLLSPEWLVEIEAEAIIDA